MKTFTLQKTATLTTKKLVFDKDFVTLYVWCPECHNYTCWSPESRSKKLVSTALKLAKLQNRKIVTFGCQTFKMNSLAVKYAMEWVRRP